MTKNYCKWTNFELQNRRPRVRGGAGAQRHPRGHSVRTPQLLELHDQVGHCRQRQHQGLQNGPPREEGQGNHFL